MLPGIGPKTLAKLKRLKITTPNDLLYHFPHRYLDFSHHLPISQVTPGDYVTVSGQITDFQNVYTKTHKNLQIATIKDSSGDLKLVWFNQPYLSTIFKPRTFFTVAGKIDFFNRQLTIFSPEYGSHHTDQIIAVYPETNQLTSRWFRKTIQVNLSNLIAKVTDPLPPTILKKYRLIPLRLALEQIHIPKNFASLQSARTRLATDEILSLLAQTKLLKLQHQSLPPKPLIIKSIAPIVVKLPFKLTTSQRSAWQEIKHDLASKKQLTNRLLVGDVGSGKTILAILSAYQVLQNHQTTLVLAPTNILAQQHFKTFKKFFPASSIKLLTSSHRVKQFPKSSIIIATHAAFKHQYLPQISLLIVDEQHKFGVSQRSFLASLPQPPHQITISATPIPRTLSLTLYNYLDLSQLEPLPHHLNPKTFLIPDHKAVDCYHWLAKQIHQHHTQAFIVCPFITESETLQSVKAATTEFTYLSQKIFPQFKLGLIHGKSNDRDQVIKQFLANKINILVTTPIIEVGIDIPNANTIIIQSADRFGLSQLHQLRGRVGRGTTQAYCYLFSQSTKPKVAKRLQFFCQSTDGQKIADFDLANRGPGEIDSNLQHGFPHFKLASISNLKLINFCQKIIREPKVNPNLLSPSILIKTYPSTS